MTFVPHSRVLPRALWRPAMLFFALAQILLAFTPLLEAGLGPDARAHIEEAGTTLHHAHSDADCSACTARGLLASSDPARPELPAFSRQSSEPIQSRVPSAQSAWALHRHSRAPPALVA